MHIYYITQAPLDVPGAEATRRASADEEALLFRHIRQRKFVGIEKSSRYRPAKPFRVLGIGLLCDGEVTFERRLHRSQDVSATTTGAHKEDMHASPVRLGSPLN